MKGRAFSIWTAAVDLVALGFLTLLLCVPVVTACPAVTALYYSAAKSIRRGRGGPYREYFRSFKENLVQGMGLSVILALFCAVGFFAATYVVNEPLSEAVDFFYRATFMFACLMAFMILSLACPVTVSGLPGAEPVPVEDGAGAAVRAEAAGALSAADAGPLGALGGLRRRLLVFPAAAAHSSGAGYSAGELPRGAVDAALHAR